MFAPEERAHITQDRSQSFSFHVNLTAKLAHTGGGDCSPTTPSMKSTIGPKTVQILIPKVYLPQGVFSKTTTPSMKSTIGPKTIQILIPKVYLPQGVFSKTNWQVYLAYAPPELCKFIYLWSAPQLPRRWNLWSVKLPAGF